MSKLYEDVAGHIAAQIEKGVYRAGDRMPGVRQLSRQFGVSISTVLEAHRLLEDQGRIEARPRSGCYVRAQLRRPPAQPTISAPPSKPTAVTGQDLVLRLARSANSPGIIQLGAAVPDPVFLPVHGMNRALAAAARRYGTRAVVYDFPPGSAELRRQIAQRMAVAGCQLGPDDIVITTGCQEALALCLRAVAEPGDIIAIESPTFYGLLQVIESLGMKALEIPTDPRYGISLDALKLAIEQWPVKACAVITNFSNPLGCCMSDEHKQRLVSLLAAHAIPLIEDDVYGDLGFAHQRPKAAKAWDRDGQVLYCASFSKTLSPGLRVGWVAPGRYQERIEYLKYVANLASSTLPQLAAADFLERGGYDRYLRQVRSEYARQVARMVEAVGRFFPEGTKVTQPAGGFVVWVEMPGQVDSLELHRHALAEGISIAPGPMFSAKQKYRNFIRLNCAHRWSDRLDRAVMTLGQLAQAMCRR